MENASKALIMAGGMLLAILIVSLLVYAWSLFSKYQASKDSLADVEDTAKFNEQFANYDRDDVQGYELISLVNKIIDYNYRKSDDGEAKNNNKYSPIKITVNFGSDDNRKSLCPEENVNNKLFSKNTYEQSNQQATRDPFKNIIETATGLENRWGGSDNATKIAKGYTAMFITPRTDDDKINAVKKFNYSSKTKYKLDVAGYTDMTNKEKDKVFQYYEYMQFKRSIFKSDSENLVYDNLTGRITKMVFNFVEIR